MCVRFSPVGCISIRIASAGDPSLSRGDADGRYQWEVLTADA
jgi:hypothetical protein